MTSGAATFITPALFRFLRELEKNNDREWFNDNKERYHDVLRDPLLAFIETLGPKLRAISSNIVADSRPVGGSLFRIYRDTRFSKDKTPYKTHAGMHFRLIGSREISSPGYYLHLEPRGCFMAAGIWHPSSDGLRSIRETIVDDPAAWKRAKRIGLDENDDSLKRPPRGFDPDHPLVEDLKRRSFTSSVDFPEKSACSPGIAGEFVKACRARKGLMGFLAGAVELAF